MNRIDVDKLFQSDQLNQNLAQKSVRGGMATMTAQGMQFVLSMVGTMILARLLTPEDYGLIGMVTVVVNFATMFKDAGLSMATVQKEAITREQISTLFWINVLISSVLGFCVFAASPVVAMFYGKSELTAVTAWLSVSFILSGLVIQHQALLRRHMRFGSLAVVMITSKIISLIVTIVLAVIGWRYWALVGGSIALALSGMILTFLLCPWIPGRMKKGTGVRDMLKFGGHLTGFNFINYFSRNADNILIGRFIGADGLGLYSRAYSLFMMPISQIRGPLTQVAMPVLSSLKEQPERYVKYYIRLIDILATVTMPMTAYCVIEADFLIKMILGTQWMGVVSVFRILAIAGLIQSIASTRGLVLISCGYSQRYFYWGLINAIVIIVSFIIGIPFGIKGVAVSYTSANYVILIPSLYYCFHKTPVTVTLFFRKLFAPLATTCTAGLAVIISQNALKSELHIAHGFYLGVFVLVYVGITLFRESMRETWKMILKGSFAKSIEQA